MRVVIQKNYDEIAEWVALYIKQKILNCKKKHFVLGLPTGSTPIGVYKRLVEFYKQGVLSFKNVITFNMDEYVGLGKNDDQSYKYFMHYHFFDHIDIPIQNINLLDGLAQNYNQECEDYERKILSVGGIDLFLAGIGQDGHIAFNEPGSSLSSITRIKTLAEDTILANSKFFQDLSQVPRQALTVGIKTIMDANEIIIMASGLGKSLAIRECIEGPISTQYTCTVAQNHNRAIVIIDELATYELKVKTLNYYKSLMSSVDLLEFLKGNPKQEILLKYVSKLDKVMIISPHPDDDVIGMGGSMELLPNKQNVKIVYMTNGDGGLNSSEQKGIRIKEALSSIAILGYDKNNLVEANLPFYFNKNREISEKDYQRFQEIINNQQPNHLFVCMDEDPNGTHKKCHQIVQKVLNDYEHPYLRMKWFFMGAWGQLGVNNSYTPNCRVTLTDKVFLKKLLSIKMHISQDNVFHNDKRTFLHRAIDADKTKDEVDVFEEKFYYSFIDSDKEKLNQSNIKDNIFQKYPKIQNKSKSIKKTIKK